MQDDVGRKMRAKPQARFNQRFLNDFLEVPEMFWAIWRILCVKYYHLQNCFNGV